MDISSLDTQSRKAAESLLTWSRCIQTKADTLGKTTTLIISLLSSTTSVTELIYQIISKLRPIRRCYEDWLLITTTLISRQLSRRITSLLTRSASPHVATLKDLNTNAAYSASGTRPLCVRQSRRIQANRQRIVCNCYSRSFDICSMA